MAKQDTIINNMVVQIDGDVLKMLLEKISDLQGQINSTQLSYAELSLKHNALARDFQLRKAKVPGYN